MGAVASFRKVKQPAAAAALVVLLGAAPAFARDDVAAAAPDADAGVVDVALVLAADVSLSMDSSELALQRNGYADALGSPEVSAAIGYGRHKRILVTYFEWGSADRQVVVAPWTVVDSPDAAARLAETIRKAPSNSLERTAMGAALIFAGNLMEQAPLKAERRVVDLSGDGPSNMGISLAVARQTLLERDITINGLPILPKAGEWPATLPPLDAYYETCVIGGLGAFSLPAENIETFAMALRSKLILEIAGLPRTGPRLERAVLPAPVNCREFD